MGCSASAPLDAEDDEAEARRRRASDKGLGRTRSMSLKEVERRVSMDVESLRAARLVDEDESDGFSEDDEEGGGRTATPPAFRSESFVRKASLVTRQKTIEEESWDVAETPSLKSGRDVFGHKHVNQYVLVKDLGRGSYGVVKLALNTSNGCLYALKMIKLNALRQNVSLVRTEGGGAERRYEDVDKVQREVALMKKLRHPNLVNLFEVIDDPGAGMLIMVAEFVEGGTVIGGQGPLPGEARRRRMMRDLVTGLDFLHHNKVLHRDIKPDNLLCTLGEDSHLKIADFGVSTFADDIGAGGGGEGGEEVAEWDRIATGLTGTPAYMAPECVGDGETFSGVAADVWACGATLYHLTYGRPPFQGVNAAAVYKATASEAIECPATTGEGVPVEAGLVDLLSHMLDKDPATRFGLKAVAKHPWLTDSGREPLTLLSTSSQRVIVTASDKSNAVRTEDRLSFKLRKASVRSFKVKKGDDLVKQGDVGTSMYLVQKGTLAVLVSDDTSGDEGGADSPPKHVADRGAGDFIGEVAALGISNVRTATLRAMEDTDVMEVTPDELSPNEMEDLAGVATERVSSQRSIVSEVTDTGTLASAADPDSVGVSVVDGPDE